MKELLLKLVEDKQLDRHLSQIRSDEERSADKFNNFVLNHDWMRRDILRRQWQTFNEDGSVVETPSEEITPKQPALPLPTHK